MRSLLSKYTAANRYLGRNIEAQSKHSFGHPIPWKLRIKR
jgi:hypothetical protein